MRTLYKKTNSVIAAFKHILKGAACLFHSDFHIVAKLLLTFIILQSLALPQFAQDSLWTKKADLNYARWHLSANYFDGKIYVIGGVGAYNAVEAYDIETDSWQVQTPMPSGRAFVGSGVVDSNIYIIGGTIFNQSAQKVVEKYDPKMDVWSTVTSMPKARFGMGSSVCKGRIYTFGGNNPAESTVEAYDPATDQWITDLADMPTARWEPECVLVDSLIYVIGGFLNPTSGTASADVEVYDPESDAWSVKASLPEKRGGGSVAYAHGKIFYFGGSSQYGPPQDNVWAYDPELDQWYTLPDMPFAWFLMPAVEVHDSIYLMAGSKIAWPHDDAFKGVYTYKPSDYITYAPYVAETPNDIESEIKTGNYRIYPNPAIHTLNIDTDYSQDKIAYRIFNICGVNQGGGILEAGSIDIEQLTRGIYFIELSTDQDKFTHTFVKAGN